MLPVVRCSNCGKAVEVSSSILFQGKAFCSEECKEQSLKVNG